MGTASAATPRVVDQIIRSGHLPPPSPPQGAAPRCSKRECLGKTGLFCVQPCGLPHGHSGSCCCPCHDQLYTACEAQYNTLGRVPLDTRRPSEDMEALCLEQRESDQLSLIVNIRTGACRCQADVTRHLEMIQALSVRFMEKMGYYQQPTTRAEIDAWRNECRLVVPARWCPVQASTPGEALALMKRWR